VNTIAEQLANLNGEFTKSGGGADLEDRRNTLLNELSAMTGASYKFEQNGAVDVHIDGIVLVMHDHVNQIHTSDEIGEPLSMYVDDGSDRKLNITNGEIGALLNVRDGDISDLRERLDDIARSIAEQVNSIHTQGYTLNGDTGVAFFSEVTGMSDFALSAAVLDDPVNVAASGDGSAGDNQIALRIAELENTPILSGGRESISQAYQSISSWFGAVVSEAQTSATGAELALAQAQAWRDSVSAVSLDEEMAELIRFQHAFNAAAKVVSGVNKMLEAVINIG
ncbi:flagellar hook-associated protein FlgK, partial [Calditrichota bacterium]